MNAQFARALWQLKQQEKKMKKSEFVKLVQSKLNSDASLKAADRAVDAVFSALKDVLLAGDRYPKLYKAWRDAIAYVIERRKEMGDPMFLAGKEVESVEDVLGVWCAGRLIGGWMNT